MKKGKCKVNILWERMLGTLLPIVLPILVYHKGSIVFNLGHSPCLGRFPTDHGVVRSFLISSDSVYIRLTQFSLYFNPIPEYRNHWYTNVSRIIVGILHASLQCHTTRYYALWSYSVNVPRISLTYIKEISLTSYIGFNPLAAVMRL